MTHHNKEEMYLNASCVWNVMLKQQTIKQLYFLFQLYVFTRVNSITKDRNGKMAVHMIVNVLTATWDNSNVLTSM